MSEHKNATAHRNPTGPWVMDTRDLGRRPGTSRGYHRKLETTSDFGIVEVIGVPSGSEVEFDVLLESVVEGVLVTGTVAGPTIGECSRCLDPLSGDIEVRVTELFTYPHTVTEATTDEDEVSRLVDDLIDLEPLAIDAVVLALPAAPLCAPDCLGLCIDCGEKLADLGPDHGHETIDPRWAALQERFGETRNNQEEN